VTLGDMDAKRALEYETANRLPKPSALPAILASVKRNNAVTFCSWQPEAYVELERICTKRYDTPHWTQFEGEHEGKHWQVNARKASE